MAVVPYEAFKIIATDGVFSMEGDISKLDEITEQNSENVVDNSEAEIAQKQNRFGLKVIAFSLVFVAFILFILSYLANIGKTLTAGIAFIILLASWIPYSQTKK